MDFKVTSKGFDALRRKLDPARIERGLDRGLSRAAVRLRGEIQGQSRVKTGAYRAGWKVERRGSLRYAVTNETEHAPYVPGRTMPTGGRRRGAGDAFMRKIKREQSGRVKEIVEDSLRRELGN